MTGTFVSVLGVGENVSLELVENGDAERFVFQASAENAFPFGCVPVGLEANVSVFAQPLGVRREVEPSRDERPPHGRRVRPRDSARGERLRP